MEQKPFADLFVDVTKRAVKIQKKDYLPMGRYPIIDQGQEWCAGFTNEEKGLYRDVPAYIFGDHTRVIKYVDKPFYLGADGVKLLKLREGIQASPRFFYYALKSQRIPDTGYNRHFKWLKESLYHVPTLDEQTHIADVLDTLSTLITLCEKKIFLFNELVKSQFIELFGDLEANPKGWKKTTFDEVSVKITDGEHATVPRVNTGYIFLNARNVLKSGVINLTGVTFISEDNHNRIYKRCNPEAGDILLTTTGTIGNVVIVPDMDAFSMDRGITLIKQDRSIINGTFFSVAMQMDSLQMHMRNGIHASAIGHLFMNKVKALPILVPHLALQNEFAAFVEQVDKSKLVLRQLLEKQKTLKAALMQEYFS